MTDIDSVRQSGQKTDTAAEAVSRLLAEGGCIRSSWGQQHAIVRNADLARWLPAAAELIGTPLLRPPYAVVLSGGKPMARERYCRSAKVLMGGTPEQVLDPDLVATELQAGAAVKFNRMELWSPLAAAVAREFGRASGKQVKVWGFLSPRGEMTFPSHRDPAHVVALQVDGRKRWRLDGPPPAGPWDSLADIEPSAESRKLSLEPGDVLYLPHGFAHCAVAESAYSYHISFALEGMSAGEVRTSVVKGIYDYLDRSDGTEVSPENLPGILDDICQSLGMMAARLSALARRNPGQIDLQAISGMFDSLRDQA